MVHQSLLEDAKKTINRRDYMREYMRRRAVKQNVRKYPPKPRMNPNLYNGSHDTKTVQFNHGSYRIEFN